MMKSFLHMLVKDPLRKILALVFTLVLYWALNEGKQREDSIDGVQMHIVCDAVALSEEKKETLKAQLGKAVAILNKPESFLMVGFEDNYDLYMGGRKLDKGA